MFGAILGTAAAARLGIAMPLAKGAASLFGVGVKVATSVLPTAVRTATSAVSSIEGLTGIRRAFGIYQAMGLIGAAHTIATTDSTSKRVKGLATAASYAAPSGWGLGGFFARQAIGAVPESVNDLTPNFSLPSIPSMVGLYTIGKGAFNYFSEKQQAPDPGLYDKMIQAQQEYMMAKNAYQRSTGKSVVPV